MYTEFLFFTRFTTYWIYHRKMNKLKNAWNIIPFSSICRFLPTRGDSTTVIQENLSGGFQTCTCCIYIVYESWQAYDVLLFPLWNHSMVCKI